METVRKRMGLIKELRKSIAYERGVRTLKGIVSEAKAKIRAKTCKEENKMKELVIAPSTRIAFLEKKSLIKRHI